MKQHLRVFALFAVAHLLSYFYRTANAVIAGDLAAEMQLDASALGLMSSLFFLTFAAAQIPVGIGLDRIGPRWVTPGLMLVGAVGSLIFAQGHSFGTLALGRALIGLGTAGILMGALKAFSRWFSVERYATISALMVSFGSCGALLSATPLARVNALFGWRVVFVGGALALTLVALSIMLWVRNNPPGELWQAPVAADGSLVDIFRNLAFWRIALLSFCMNGVLLSLQGLWAGPYLADVYLLDKIAAGNLIFLMALGTALGFGCSGWLADRFGLAPVVTAGALLLLVCQLLLAWQPALTLIPLINMLFGFGAGCSIVMLPQIRRLFPSGLTGRAVSAGNLFGFAGTFVMQWVMGAIINLFAKDGTGHYPSQAYTVALLFTAVCTLLALIGYLPFLKKQT